MTTCVHATSLASVTEVASNPPAHLNTPLETLSFPLVLYIAKVPGSRDVFLTPMKPRNRVVTAEDVQSALYFVHINSAKDFEEKTQIGALNTLTEEDSEHYSLPPLPRRPVTETSQLAENRIPYANQRPPSPAKKTIINRKALPFPKSHITADGQRHPVLPVLPARPLPPVPSEAANLSSLHNENVRLLRHADHTNTDNPYNHVYAAGQDTWVDPAIRPEADTLTLIRRDPSTHEQWNVAFIRDPPVEEVSSASAYNNGPINRSRRSGAPIYLDITNPSYSQFLSPAEPSDSFFRRVYMPSSRNGENIYRHARLGSDSSSMDTRSTRGSLDINDAGTTTERRTKGYTFISPWNSSCEFHTGATGGSLKCRHFLNAARGVEVSELRFNLPTVNSPRQLPGTSGVAEKRRSHLHGFHRRLRSKDSSGEPEPLGRRTPTLVLEEDERVDLSLGQEKAGGGFGGRQAKLGKLIIEPEGIKMLDLLVAANIGLWWRAYDR